MADPLLSLGRWLIHTHLRRTVDRTGFRARAVLLEGGIRAAYLEREGDEENPGPPLLVLPGMTTSARYMAMRVAYLADTFLKRRIVIMELPHHGANASRAPNLEENPLHQADVMRYTLRFATAIGLKAPFDVLGYSFGGGLGALIHLQHPEKLRKVVLVAPFLPQISTPEFLQTLALGQWRAIHGWESYDEMLGFFHNWLGMNRWNKPPKMLLRGMHDIRREMYAPGHFSRVFESIRTSMESDTVPELPQRPTDKDLTAPVLILAGEWDRCCDVDKMPLLTEALGAQLCTLHRLPAGHNFTPRMGRSLFDISRETTEAFLR